MFGNRDIPPGIVPDNSFPHKSPEMSWKIWLLIVLAPSVPLLLVRLLSDQLGFGLAVAIAGVVTLTFSGTVLIVILRRRRTASHRADVV